MNYAIKVTPPLSKAVQEYLFGQGFKWYWMGKCTIQHQNEKILLLDIKNKIINYSNDVNVFNLEKNTTVSFEKLIALVEPIKSSMMIGKRKVKFIDGGIKIGCEEISFFEIRDINNWLKEKQIAIL